MSDIKRLRVSFSGGETSAYMTLKLLEAWRLRYDEVVVTFANTGEEHEETLAFVDRCDRNYGFKTVWLEADVDSRHGRGVGHKVVSFESASRKGEPFEDVCRKYGVSNKSWPKCTTMLKERPMEHYTRKVLDWRPGTYHTAIGIRSDEVDRMSSRAAEMGLIYPLIRDLPSTKPDINAFWKSQPFRLRLKSWQGNCKWCWKKSKRKHFTNIQDNPEWYAFPDRMERLYGRVGPEFEKRPDARNRVFFRGNQSTAELIAEALGAEYRPPSDSNDFDPKLDVGGGCEESCEVFSDVSEMTTDEGIFG